MKNMKKLTFKLACFFLSLLVSSVAMAESITSPNGLLKLNVSVNEKGEPVYELSYTLIPQHYNLTLFISS